MSLMNKRTEHQRTVRYRCNVQCERCLNPRNIKVVPKSPLPETVLTWTHLADLPLPREVDPENPIAAHESDCHVFYMFNYPMTCGEELVFNPGTLACEPAENVADSRPECASASGA